MRVCLSVRSAGKPGRFDSELSPKLLPLQPKLIIGTADQEAGVGGVALHVTSFNVV